MNCPISEKLRHQRILILGFGKEGQSTLRFLLEHLQIKPAAIADQNPVSPTLLNQLPTDIQIHTGENYLSFVQDYDLTIKAPGIPLRLIPNQFHYKITSQTNLFLSKYAHQTIGITGTKGKSTTSSLIHFLLLESGRDSILAGNIGIPAFDIIPLIREDSVVVYEMSANQLEMAAYSSHIAVLLNIYEEHLDHFGSFEAYCQAKLKIVAMQNPHDFAIVHPDWIGACAHSVSTIQALELSFIPSVNENPLLGDHNLININAAFMALAAAGISTGELKHLLPGFKPLPHRLEHCGRADEVIFINDSIATIPEACLSAIHAVGKVDFLLLGGFDRGIQYDKLAKVISDLHIPHILFTGEAGKRIAGMIPKEVPGQKLLQYSSMQQAFEYIAQHSIPGDVCLLSPAAASYDQYRNFEHRGEVFKENVALFKRKTP